jgi:membrane protease YdiL (CAAX protease family)
LEFDPKQDSKLKISSELLWNKSGMIQQAVMFTLMLIVYVSISIISSRSNVVHTGFENWLQNLQKLFARNTLLHDILFGAITGLVLSIILFVMDAFVAFIVRTDVKEWIHRTDYLLPQTKKQRSWALSITLVGSIQEEIMFRGFIFLAMLPLWSHWIWAALILSGVFSLLHTSVQGFWSTLWIFVISLTLCFFVSQGKSIYFIALVHIMINLTNLFILPLMFKKRDE